MAAVAILNLSLLPILINGPIHVIAGYTPAKLH